MSTVLNGVAGSMPLPNAATVPVPSELVQAVNVQVVTQALLDQDKTLETRGVFDTIGRPGGNPVSVAFIGTPSILAVTAQIQGAEIGEIAMPSASAPKVELNVGNTGRAVAEDLQVNAQPARTADVGADNLLTGPRVCKAWALFTIGNNSVTIHDGDNIDDIVITGVTTVGNVTFARQLGNVTYSITWGYGTPDVTAVNGTRLQTDFNFSLWQMSTGAGPHILTTPPTYEVEFHVFGRQ